MINAPLRSLNFVRLSERARVAVERLATVAGTADEIADTPPRSVPVELVRGVRRPTEDLVCAREGSGLSVAVGRARAAAMQAVLHLERAVAACENVEQVFERKR